MLSARHFLGAGFVVTAVLFAGCAAKPRRAGPYADRGLGQSRGQPADAAANPTRHAPAAQAPTGDAGQVAPQSLAQHAGAYARNLESLLAKRQSAATAPAERSVPTTQPSVEPPAPRLAANTAMQAQSSAATTRPAATAPEPLNQKEPIPAAQQAGSHAPAPGRTVPPASDALVQKLTAKLKDYPTDVTAHLEYQLLQFLRDESVPDLQAVAPLPTEDRELLAALLDGLSNFRNCLRAEGNLLQSKKVAPLLEMADRLRAQGELSIPTAALCREVKQFGVYDPMESAQFTAGKPSEAILYCEIANFSSQLNDKKQYETRLKHEGVLYSDTGQAVWPDKTDTMVDVSRNRRHDFFIAEKLRLPATLPVGRYLLKVTVTDLQANRVAEATVPLQIVAQLR